FAARDVFVATDIRTSDQLRSSNVGFFAKRKLSVLGAPSSSSAGWQCQAGAWRPSVLLACGLKLELLRSIVQRGMDRRKLHTMAAMETGNTPVQKAVRCAVRLVPACFRRVR